MVSQNLERNKMLYEHWERGGTVDRVADLTGIPRSTVGYYFRKFNRLASEGKPIVISERSGTRGGGEGSTVLIEFAKQMSIVQLRANAMKMFQDGEYQDLYYMLMDLKMMREFGSIVSFETFERMNKSISGQ